MADITLEKTHALLDKLASYVMTALPTRNELDQKLAQKADKTDVDRLEKRVHTLDEKMNLLLNGMDAQAHQLDIISTDMKAVSPTLDNHEKRLAMLEKHVFGFRVRENKENYNADHTQK